MIRHTRDELETWTCEELIDAVQTLESEVDALDQRWHSPRETMASKFVLVCFRRQGYAQPGYALACWRDESLHWRNQFGLPVPDVIAWMHLPEPPDKTVQSSPDTPPDVETPGWHRVGE